MDKAFIIGCWLVMATVVAVFVICTLLNHRQFKKLGLPLEFPPLQTDKTRIDHIRLEGWCGGMMELRYRIHNDSLHAMPVSTAFKDDGFTLHVCGATVPEGLPDLLQTTLLPGHSITVTQRFYWNQFRKDCHIGRFQPLPECCTTEHWRLTHNATGLELTPIIGSVPQLRAEGRISQRRQPGHASQNQLGLLVARRLPILQDPAQTRVPHTTGSQNSVGKWTTRPTAKGNALMEPIEYQCGECSKHTHTCTCRHCHNRIWRCRQCGKPLCAECDFCLDGVCDTCRHRTLADR